MKGFPPTLGITGLYFPQASKQWSELNQQYLPVGAGAHLRWASSAYAGHPERGYDLLMDTRDEASTIFEHERLDFSLTDASFHQQSLFQQQIIQGITGKLPLTMQYQGKEHGSGMAITVDDPLLLHFNQPTFYQGLQFSMVGADLALEEKSSSIHLGYASGHAEQYSVKLHFLEQKSFYLPLHPQLNFILIESPGCLLTEIQFFSQELDAFFAAPNPQQQLLGRFNISTDFSVISQRIPYPGNQLRLQDEASFELLYDQLVEHAGLVAPILEELSLSTDERDYYSDVGLNDAYYVMNPHQLLSQCSVDAEMAKALGLYTIIDPSMTVPYAAYILRANFRTERLFKDGQAVSMHSYAFAPPLQEEQYNPILPYEQFQIVKAEDSSEVEDKDIIGNKIAFTFNNGFSSTSLPILCRISRLEKASSESEESPIIDEPILIDEPPVLFPGTPEIIAPEIISPELEIPGGIVFKPYDYRKQLLISVEENEPFPEAVFWDTFQPRPEELKLHFEYQVQGFDVWGRANNLQILEGDVFYQPTPQAPDNPELARPQNEEGTPLDALNGAFYWRKAQCESDHKVDHFELLFGSDGLQGLSTKISQVEDLADAYLLTLDLEEDRLAWLQKTDHYITFEDEVWALEGSTSEADAFYSWEDSKRVRLPKNRELDFISLDSGFGELDPNFWEQPTYLLNPAQARFLNKNLQFKSDLKQVDNWKNHRKHLAINLELNQPLREREGQIKVYLSEYVEQVFVAFEPNVDPFSDYTISAPNAPAGSIFKVEAGSIVQDDKEYRLASWNGPVPNGWTIPNNYKVYTIDELYDDIIYYIPQEEKVIVYPRIVFSLPKFDFGQIQGQNQEKRRLFFAARAKDQYHNWSVVSAHANLFWMDYSSGKLPVLNGFPVEEDALRRLQIPQASYPDYFGQSRFEIKWPTQADQTYALYRSTASMLLAEAEEQGVANQLNIKPQHLVLQQFRELEEWEQYQILILLVEHTDCQDAFSQLSDQPLKGNPNLSFIDQNIDGHSSEIYLYKLKAFSPSGVASPLSKLLAIAKSPAIPVLVASPKPSIRSTGQSLEVELPYARPNAKSYFLLLEDEITAPQEENAAIPLLPDPGLGIPLDSDLIPSTPTLEDFVSFGSDNTQLVDVLARLEDYPWQNSKITPLTNMQAKSLMIDDGVLDLVFLSSYNEVSIEGLYLVQDLPASTQQNLDSLQVDDLANLKNYVDLLGEGDALFIYNELEIEGKRDALIIIHVNYSKEDGSMESLLIHKNTDQFIQEIPTNFSLRKRLKMYRLMTISDDGLHTGEVGEPFFLEW